MNLKTQVIDRLKEMGASPKRSLGQNFLVSQSVISKIIEAVESFSPGFVVEVGPGLGALTEQLHQKFPDILLIELDRVFSGFWREQGCKVLEEDALKVDWQELKLESNSILVSNLPYQISSSLVIDRSVQPFGIEGMVLMFQKEVAQRIMCSKSQKNYGLLSVIAQCFWEIRTVCEAGPRDFYPPPNVASRVLKFSSKESPIENRPRFLWFVKSAFAQRRKRLMKNLSSTLKSGDNMSNLHDVLADLGYPDTVRAEELKPSEFVLLFKALEEKEILQEGPKI